MEEDDPEEELLEEDDPEEEPICEVNPDEELAKKGDFEEQWERDEDLEETTLDQESGEILMEEIHMERMLAAKEEPKPEAAYWKWGRRGRMCRGTCPLDTFGQ